MKCENFSMRYLSINDGIQNRFTLVGCVLRTMFGQQIFRFINKFDGTEDVILVRATHSTGYGTSNAFGFFQIPERNDSSHEKLRTKNQEHFGLKAKPFFALEYFP
jgi:hypothetical protein